MKIVLDKDLQIHGIVIYVNLDIYLQVKFVKNIMILYKDVLLEISMIIKNVLYVKVVIIWKEDKIVQKIYDVILLNYYTIYLKYFKLL